MSRLSLLERYNTLLNEEIHPSEASTDEGSLLTLIKGKRDVAYMTISKRFRKILEKYKFGIIPIRMIGINEMKAIVYRNKEKALRLYEIARKNNGYLADKTSEEAREIGELLGYYKEEINKYIQKRYGYTVPIVNEPSPDDIIDLTEQKKTIKENTQFKRTIELIKKINTFFILHFLIF